MIKGMPIVTSSYSDISYNNILYLAEHRFQQDTLKTGSSGTSINLQVQKPNLIYTDTSSINSHQLEELFKAAEERERNISNQKVKISSLKEDTATFEGSTSRVYSEIIPSFKKLPDYNFNPLSENFLHNISEKTVDIHFKVKDSTIVNTAAVSSIEKPEIPLGFEGKLRDYGTDGWYVFALLISLSIFAWGKSLYQKYLLQIINSVYNYQTSIQLFRDRNALFRNLSIILQILFPINVGLLIYFLISYYKLNHASDLPILNLIIYSASVLLFFRLKNLIYKFLGVVFKVQDEFNEIQHHMNIFLQTIGVVLLPFIVSMPFLEDNIINIFLIALFLIVGIFVLLFFFRGFQIVSRKQVPFFFLILYLCAVEILPVALLVKTSYSII